MRVLFVMLLGSLMACGDGLDSRGLGGHTSQSPQGTNGTGGVVNPGGPSGEEGEDGATGSTSATGTTGTTGTSGTTGNDTGAKPVDCPQGTGLDLSAPWPTRGFCPDGQGRSSQNGPLTKPHEVWTADLDWRWINDPVVAADGTVYVFAGNAPSVNAAHLYGYDAAGDEVLSLDPGGEILSQPAIGADGFISALVAKSGGVRQVLRLDPKGKQLTFANAPKATSLTLLPNGDLALVSASATASDPMRVWSMKANGTAGAIDQTLSAAEILATKRGLWLRSNGNLAIAAESAVRLLTATGELERDLPTNTFFYFVAFAPGAILYSSGVADTYFARWDENGVRSYYDFGYTRGTSTPIARDSDGSIRVGFAQMAEAVGDNSLIAGKIVRYDADGKKKWTVSTGPLTDTQPTLGADGTVYVASRAGTIYAIAPNGSTRWTYDVGAVMNNTQIAIGLGNKLYVATEDGRLIALGP